MALASVEVPATLVVRLRETVVLLFHATAEALHFALRAYAEGRGPLDEVHRHRTRLLQLDALLGRLGWSSGSEGAERLVLTAPEEILRDAVCGALIDSGERLAAASAACWRGEVPPEGVRGAAAEVIALDGLLRRIR